MEVLTVPVPLNSPVKAQDLNNIPALVEQLALALKARGHMMVSAESCTGGLIASACTELSGSSGWFERGFVVYSNAAKHELLGVPADLIAAHGAVSEPVAHAMAAGALRHARAHWSVAVTGIAGPTGGSVDKPVGTVWFAWATPTGVFTEQRCFDGERAMVRQAAVAHAIAGLLKKLSRS